MASDFAILEMLQTKEKEGHIYMLNYVLITLAAVLLTVDFVLQKQYQQKAGSSSREVLFFNAANGLFTAAVFWAISGFRIEFSPYSLVMAVAMTLLALLYSLIGFRILANGGVGLYSLFLMTGGMTVPYIFGLIFLGEPVSFFRILGLVCIIGSIILANGGQGSKNRKVLLLCAAVFFLNGFVSVVSKLHQINTDNAPVGASSFVFWTGIAKFIMCAVVLAVGKKNAAQEKLPARPNVLAIILASALVGGVSYLCQLIGAKDLPASVLYPFVTGGSIVLSDLVGIFLYKEKTDMIKQIGIAVCFAGTCLFLL